MMNARRLPHLLLVVALATPLAAQEPTDPEIRESRQRL